MIRAGFLDSESRQDLIELTRDGSAAHRLARRANALLLLDDGMSCEAVAKVLYLDDDTIRIWHRLYQEDGIEGLASFGYEGSACRLTVEQRERLTAWITETLPRTSREIGAWIARECGIEYEGRSGLIALLHRLGMEHRKPTAISRKLDPAKQAAFIRSYEALLNQLPADEAVMFADAVHPTHAVRAVGCWAPKDIPVAITQSSGRERLNIHGAIDLGCAGGERCEYHHAADGDRGDVSWQAADPCISGQRPVSSCEAGAAMAGTVGMPDPAALHPVILPASGSNRTIVGIDAPALHPQQMLRWVQGFHSCGTDFSAREGAAKLACLLRPGHRQLPRHRSRRFSGSRVKAHPVNSGEHHI